ncbi:MAG: 1-acyl-sn-glycerol-3-phosphate acyltransferase [Candidatus Omnitrophica bacterium]|nr:1-acyl-sn-glycerol-3-phosphate acyltransferase [Candidatus Omnitrophota bacterium]
MFFKICFRYKAKYVDNFPKKGPFIIASNHLSFLDPVAIGLATKRRVSFLARADLFKSNIFNWWATSVGVIPIERRRLDLSAIKGTLDNLKKGGVVALFPEGTRSKDGVIKEPKAGVGFVAVKAGVPVVPIFIKGSDKALPHHAIFIRLKPIEVMIGEPVEPKMFLKVNGTYDYGALTKEVMKRIERFSHEG